MNVKGPKVYNGKGQKKCNCPLHNGEFIGLENFWVHKRGHRKGKPFSRCVGGELLYRGRDPKISGFISIRKPVVENTIIELERRLGREETMRRAGLSYSFYKRWTNREYKTVRKRTFKKLVELLIEVRQRDEVRHRDSIRRGAAARGEPEKIPVDSKDYYRPTGDGDNEQRRNYRKRPENVEHAREVDRKRWRKRQAAAKAAKRKLKEEVAA